MQIAAEEIGHRRIAMAAATLDDDVLRRTGEPFAIDVGGRLGGSRRRNFEQPDLRIIGRGDFMFPIETRLLTGMGADGFSMFDWPEEPERRRSRRCPSSDDRRRSFHARRRPAS